jgi:hypothetical protein
MNMNRRNLLAGIIPSCLLFLGFKKPEKKIAESQSDSMLSNDNVVWVVEYGELYKVKGPYGIYSSRSLAIQAMNKLGPGTKGLYPIFLDMTPEERKKQNIINGNRA